MSKRNRITRKEADESGLTIDSTCYPNVAYKGDRSEPDEWYEVPTEKEEKATDLLKLCKSYLRLHNPSLGPTSICALRDVQWKIKEFLGEKG